MVNLKIDGNDINMEERAPILDAVKALGLDNISLRQRPLAARIGGEVVSLNHIPEKDADIRLLRYSDDMGRRVYERTLQFIFILAMRRLYPGVKVRVRYSLGSGLLVTVTGCEPFGEDRALAIESEMRLIVRQGLPFTRRRIPIGEAVEFFEKDAQTDKAKLLKWRKFSYFDVYKADDYMDYYYGEMAPDSSYIDVFRLKYLSEGELLLLLPRVDAPDVPSDYLPSPKLHMVFSQSDEWGDLMRCSTVNDLNTLVENGGIRELVRVNEALHERGYADLADKILKKGARAVLVAGPSSSGKTTSAHRIATQLRVKGCMPIMLSLDDYYLNREDIPTDDDGEVDLEAITTLDIPRFCSDLSSLINTGEAETPLFDFKTGKRREHGRPLKLSSDQPIIIEGLHGLNPMLLTEDVDATKVFKVYVSALTTLNLDDHNRIRTTDVRILRRLVRDYMTRNSSMEDTLGMWRSVRAGEEKWIFPFQEQADALFNTTLIYEVSVLKKYVYPLLSEVRPESRYYGMAKDIVKFLNYILDADIEDEIPPVSILREFIGGNSFYRK